MLLIHGDADKVTSIKATQTFCARIDADDKEMIVFLVGLVLYFSAFPSLILLCVQDGYHELQNELPEVRQKLIDDIVSFVDAHTSADNASDLQVPSFTTSSSPPVLPILDTSSSLESPVPSAGDQVQEGDQTEGPELTTKL